MVQKEGSVDDNCAQEPKRLRLTVAPGTLTALLGRTDMREAATRGYTHIIPMQRFDLARIGAIEHQFRELGIRYGTCDVYPAFQSKEELDAALVAVYNSGWDERWAIQDYLVGQDLIEKPKDDR